MAYWLFTSKILLFSIKKMDLIVVLVWWSCLCNCQIRLWGIKIEQCLWSFMAWPYFLFINTLHISHVLKLLEASIWVNWVVVSRNIDRIINSTHISSLHLFLGKFMSCEDLLLRRWWNHMMMDIGKLILKIRYFIVFLIQYFLVYFHHSLVWLL